MADFTIKTWYDQSYSTPASADQLNDLEARISSLADGTATEGDIETLQLQIAALASSSTSVKYTHNQTVSSSTWAINHNMGTLPISIYVIDEFGNEILGADRSDPDNNTTVLSYAQSAKGKAYLQG